MQMVLPSIPCSSWSHAVRCQAYVSIRARIRHQARTASPPHYLVCVRTFVLEPCGLHNTTTRHLLDKWCSRRLPTHPRSNSTDLVCCSSLSLVASLALARVLVPKRSGCGWSETSTVAHDSLHTTWPWMRWRWSDASKRTPWTHLRLRRRRKRW